MGNGWVEQKSKREKELVDANHGVLTGGVGSGWKSPGQCLRLDRSQKAQHW